MDNIDECSLSFIKNIRGNLPSSIEELTNIVLADCSHKIPIGPGNQFTSEFRVFVENCCSTAPENCCEDFLAAFSLFDTAPLHACEYGGEMEVVPIVNAALFPLQVLLQTKSGRNTQTATTGMKLPDYKITVGAAQTPVVLGEDKTETNYQRGVQKKDPVLDLQGKAPWNNWAQFYGTLPYYFGYTSVGGVNGVLLTFGVLLKADQTFHPLLCNRIDRAHERAVFAIGLVKLFPVVAEVARLAELVDGPNWALRKWDNQLQVGRKMAVAFENNVPLFRKEWKFNNTDAATAFHSKLTNVFNQVGSVDPSVLCLMRLHSRLVLDEAVVHGYFTPYGKPLSVRTEHGLLSVVRNIAIAVELLHDLRVVHNDIRWDNIVSVDNGICIVDFDDAVCLSEDHPTCPALPHLSGANHSQLSFTPHGREVDRWSVAHLLLTSTVCGLSLETIQLAHEIQTACQTLEMSDVVTRLTTRLTAFNSAAPI